MTPRSLRLADQPPEPLPQLKHRRRQRVGREPVPSLGRDPLAARLVERIVRRLERQLVDHEQRERLSGDVDALPERAGGDEHRADVVAELLEEPLARRFALDEQLVPIRPRRRSATASSVRYELVSTSARPEESSQSWAASSATRSTARGVAGPATPAAGGAAPAPRSRTASRPPARARREAEPVAHEAEVASPVVSVAETRIAVGPPSQSASRSRRETSTGAQPRASARPRRRGRARRRRDTPARATRRRARAAPGGRARRLRPAARRQLAERVDEHAALGSGGSRSRRLPAAGATARNSAPPALDAVELPRGDGTSGLAAGAARRRSRAGETRASRPAPPSQDAAVSSSRCASSKTTASCSGRIDARLRATDVGEVERVVDDHEVGLPARSRAACAKQRRDEGAARPGAAVGADRELAPERLGRLELQLGPVARLGLVEPRHQPPRAAGSSFRRQQERAETLQLPRQR